MTGGADPQLLTIPRLKNNQTADPLGLFSEANLDLLAFLIFLAVAKEAAERGQARLLVLDDVLQSVDAVFRARVSALHRAGLSLGECLR